MQPDDEPALKLSADAASGAAQRTFLRLTAAQLGALTVGAGASSWSPADLDTQRGVAWAVAFAMFAALMVGVALKLGRFDDKWFRLRALAENVKSAMWYFVMSPADERPAREKEYRQAISDIQAKFPLSRDLVAHRVDGPAITEWMSRTHGLGLSEKLAIYTEERLNDQIGWYQRKAAFNGERESRWQWTVLVLEAAAIVGAVVYAWVLWPLNVAGMIAALAAAFVAWSQTKRYSDLANSYAVASDDLRRIRDEFGHPNTQEELLHLVKAVEAAVSREHSMWLSRRLL